MKKYFISLKLRLAPTLIIFISIVVSFYDTIVKDERNWAQKKNHLVKSKVFEKRRFKFNLCI